jgi:hypothetical protein
MFRYSLYEKRYKLQNLWCTIIFYRSTTNNDSLITRIKFTYPVTNAELLFCAGLKRIRMTQLIPEGCFIAVSSATLTAEQKK